ncbi:TPA: hypothetical protein P0E06_003462 [Vibrio fluvialis clinical-1]|jgi:Mor family transcriptional regulator|nr:hypothetical protein [Vibrio cholerae]HDM8036041.1 hypothetical protein [Vibrio fluvialis clinical-1]
MRLNEEELSQLYPLLSPTSKTLLELFENALDKNETCAFELLLKVSSELGGTYVYIPQEQRMKRRLRDIAICHDFKSGTSPSQLALKHQLSIQKVYRVLNAHPSSGDE